MLELLTFTGVDENTPFKSLEKIAKKYPKVEFGILVGSHTGEYDHGIFPSLRFVKQFKNAAKIIGFNTALHLCGKYSRGVMQQDGAHGDTFDLCNGFDRIQINLHGDWWHEKWIGVNTASIRRFADSVTDGTVESVILQHRGQWGDLPVRHPHIEYLFDVSGGAGMDSIDIWPPPIFDEQTRFGFAGGLGPDNMHRAMDFVWVHQPFRMWMDMEGKVRTDGVFDTDKIAEVCKIAFPETE